MSQMLNILEARLRKHDYTYEHSDDHRYWVAGTRDKEEIFKMIKELVAIEPEVLPFIVELIIKYRVEYGTDFMEALK